MSFSVDRYLDRTYHDRNYNCWHLLAEAWRDLTGDELDQISPTGKVGPPMDRIDQPRSPCVVLMITPGHVPHAGLYRNGRVLHIDRQGARCERLENAIWGFAEIRYYAKRDADPRPAGPA